MSQSTVIPVTDAQMRAMESLISVSRDAGVFAKQLVIWLLRQTKGLTEPCTVLVPLDVFLDHGLTDSAWRHVDDGIHVMNSSNRTTRLDLLFVLIGSSMHISRVGDETTGCSVWCSHHSFGRGDLVREVAFDLASIQKVDIWKLR